MATRKNKPRALRRKNDFYETPSWMVASLLKHAKVPQGLICEPCAGKSAIAVELVNTGRAVEQFDIDPQFGHLVTDARSIQYSPDVAGIITNPPFNVSFDIVKNAVEQNKWCAFLIRVTFLEPTKSRSPRGAWLEKNPPSQIIVQPRHSFTGKGSDSATVAWMIWNGRPSSAIVIDLDSYKAR